MPNTTDGGLWAARWISYNRERCTALMLDQFRTCRSRRFFVDAEIATITLQLFDFAQSWLAPDRLAASFRIAVPISPARACVQVRFGGEAVERRRCNDPILQEERPNLVAVYTRALPYSG